MGTSRSNPIDRLKQPEYTGENRCIPCTTVNVVIAIVLAGAIALASLSLADATVAVAAAVAVLALSLAAIYLRGYLVPGTPTITKRYFPDWLLAKFDKDPLEPEFEEAALEEDDPPESVDPEEWLLEQGVVEPCADVDDLCLAPGIDEVLHGRFERIREGDRTRQVAAFLEVDPETLTIAEGGGRIRAQVDGRLVAHWRSESALVVDLTAADVLEERVPEWQRLSVQQRSKVANGLRAFVDRCPLCSEPVSIEEEEKRSCCRSYQTFTIGCEECDERLLEIKQNGRAA